MLQLERAIGEQGRDALHWVERNSSPERKRSSLCFSLPKGDARRKKSSDGGELCVLKLMVGPLFGRVSSKGFSGLKLAAKSKGGVGGVLGRSSDKHGTEIRIDAGLGRHNRVSEVRFFSLPSV